MTRNIYVARISLSSRYFGTEDGFSGKVLAGFRSFDERGGLG